MKKLIYLLTIFVSLSTICQAQIFPDGRRGDDDCGTPLPLTIISFYGRVINNQIELNWQAVEKTPITVLYSNNGITWTELSTNAHSPFYVTTVSNSNYLKIRSIDSIYSKTLMFKLNITEDFYLFYDLNGKLLNEIPFNSIYLKYNTNTKEATKEWKSY